MAGLAGGEVFEGVSVRADDGGGSGQESADAVAGEGGAESGVLKGIESGGVSEPEVAEAVDGDVLGGARSGEGSGGPRVEAVTVKEGEAAGGVEQVEGAVGVGGDFDEVGLGGGVEGEEGFGRRERREEGEEERQPETHFLMLVRVGRG